MWHTPRISSWSTACVIFLLYINDFHRCSRNLDFHLFADDSNLFYKYKNLVTLQSNVNKELMNTWFCANKLSLNMEKSNFIIFHSVQKRLTYNIKLEINGIELKRTESIRYLGVFLDSNLNGKSHIGYICKKLKRSTGMFFQNSLLYWHQHFSQIVLCINISVFNLWCNYLGHNVSYHIASPICFAKKGYTLNYILFLHMIRLSVN